MGFVRGITKITVGLIGMAVMLAGVGGFFWGVFTILKGKTGSGVLLIASSILAMTVATFMGNYARGDYD
ncbi:MAG: hypothetical protein NTW38_00580 [Candidatus Aminicenantes bacterium]|nr:hypothetical protein [Candidatus Aminicenantes bacterium]